MATRQIVAEREHRSPRTRGRTGRVRAAVARDVSLRLIINFDRRLDLAAARLAEVAKAVSARGAWDDRWLDQLDEPPTEKTYGGAIAHVITHRMHHRAQLLYMLRQLGVKDLPEGDVLSWEHQRESA